MENLNIKHAAISSGLVYITAIMLYVGSYFIPLMNDPELQANLALMLGIIPAAYLGAHVYYQKGHNTSGIILGFVMFLGAIVLDATITVPLFIMPNGGSHLSFFSDPGFWLIGLEYILVVVAYWRFKVVKTPRTIQA